MNILEILGRLKTFTGAEAMSENSPRAIFPGESLTFNFFCKDILKADRGHAVIDIQTLLSHFIEANITERFFSDKNG